MVNVSHHIKLTNFLSSAARQGEYVPPEFPYETEAGDMYSFAQLCWEVSLTYGI